MAHGFPTSMIHITRGLPADGWLWHPSIWWPLGSLGSSKLGSQIRRWRRPMLAMLHPPVVARNFRRKSTLLLAEAHFLAVLPSTRLLARPGPLGGQDWKNGLQPWRDGPIFCLRLTVKDAGKTVPSFRVAPEMGHGYHFLPCGFDGLFGTPCQGRALSSPKQSDGPWKRKIQVWGQLVFEIQIGDAIVDG